MRSIRLSLVVYFLSLLTVALGCASLLIYRSAQITLENKEKATRELVNAKHEEGVREVNTKLDEELLKQAESLARRTQIQQDWNRFNRRSLHGVLGLATSQAVPGVPWHSLLWINESVPRSPIYFQLFRTELADIRLVETELTLPVERPVGDYFQIDSNYWFWTRPLCSPSLGSLRFPDPQAFAKDDVLHKEWDDFELAPGLQVRRIRMRTASTQHSPRPRGPSASSRGRGKV